MIASVINHQAIPFPLIQPQASADNLLIQAYRLSRPQDGDQVHMGGIKPGRQHRHIHQVLQLPLFEALDQLVAISQISRAGHQGGFLLGQVPGNFLRVLHCRRENHHPLALGRHLHHLFDDGTCHPLMFAQQLVDVFLGVFAKTVLRQRGEIVLGHGGVNQFRPGEVTTVDHVAQGQFVDAVPERLVLFVIRTTNKTPVVVTIDPSHGQAVGSGGEPKHLQGVILLP